MTENRFSFDQPIEGFGWSTPETLKSGKVLRHVNDSKLSYVTLPLNTTNDIKIIISVPHLIDLDLLGNLQISVNGAPIAHHQDTVADEIHLMLDIPATIHNAVDTLRVSFLTHKVGFAVHWMTITAKRQATRSIQIDPYVKSTPKTELVYSQPVFIVGCPRSGTSALAWSVASHEDFWTSAESDFMHLLFGPANRLKNIYNEMAKPPAERQRWLIENDVNLQEFMRYVGWGVDQLFLSRSGGKRWVDQSPAYTLIAKDLCDLFPNAKFLHALRDGRRVVHSMINSGFPAPWATDFKKACETWTTYVNLSLELQDLYPDRVHVVRNERLISDPEDETRAYLAFLDALYSDEPANFLRSNWINSSFGKKPSQPSTAPWEQWSPEQHATFDRIAGYLMRDLGYVMA
jgi:hypothetical protein